MSDADLAESIGSLILSCQWGLFAELRIHFLCLVDTRIEFTK